VFDPRDVTSIAAFDEASLVRIPTAEDDLFEFKSSLVADAKLAEKISAAASAFWNSGGGFLIVGVNNAGDADGGIAQTVGNQPRRDWVDQHLARVEPRGRYSIGLVTSNGDRGTIDSGKCVLVIGFQESADIPHMASDKHYYVRAGAHTVKAGHFLVEALRARRSSSSPLLNVMLQQDERNLRFVNVSLVNLSNAAAFDVRLDVTPTPPLFNQFYNSGSVSRRFIGASSTERFRWTMYDQNTRKWFNGDTEYTVKIHYSDALGRHYGADHVLTASTELGVKASIEEPIHQVASSLSDINLSLKSIALKNSNLQP
jgi:Putative DNA-binding domain